MNILRKKHKFEKNLSIHSQKPLLDDTMNRLVRFLPDHENLKTIYPNMSKFIERLKEEESLTLDLSSPETNITRKEVKNLIRLLRLNFLLSVSGKTELIMVDHAWFSELILGWNTLKEAIFANNGALVDE